MDTHQVPYVRLVKSSGSSVGEDELAWGSRSSKEHEETMKRNKWLTFLDGELGFSTHSIGSGNNSSRFTSIPLCSFFYSAEFSSLVEKWRSRRKISNQVCLLYRCLRRRRICQGIVNWEVDIKKLNCEKFWKV